MAPELLPTITECPTCSSPVVNIYVWPNRGATYTTACGERWKVYPNGDGPSIDHPSQITGRKCQALKKMHDEQIEALSVAEKVLLAEYKTIEEPARKNSVAQALRYVQNLKGGSRA